MSMKHHHRHQDRSSALTQFINLAHQFSVEDTHSTARSWNYFLKTLKKLAPTDYRITDGAERRTNDPIVRQISTVMKLYHISLYPTTT